MASMRVACRPGGIVSVPGVYGGMLDKIPFGAAMNKGLTIRTGQTHVNRWTDDLLRRIEDGQIDLASDGRWVQTRRPVVIAGGELTLDALELDEALLEDMPSPRELAVEFEGLIG